MIFDCYIITSKDATRKYPLISSLSSDARFKIHEVPGCYPEDLPPLIDIRWEVARLKLRREISLGEIGISIIHRKIQTIIARTGKLSIVFEDDARIENLDYLFNVCYEFTKNSKQSCLLNLSDSRANRGGNYGKENHNNRSTALCGVSELALGYLITPSGAKELSNANFPIYSPADWPFAKIRHFVLLKPAVSHGDLNTESTVDANNALNRGVKNSLTEKFLILSFIDYITYRSKFLNIKEYVQLILKHRIDFYLDVVYMKVKNFFFGYF
jgi:hypothetical protein